MMQKSLLILVLVPLLLIALLLVATGKFFYDWGVATAMVELPITQRLSPDERYRVILKGKYANFIDRNFKIILEDLKTHKQTVVFDSPDEGTPIGSERLLWSADGKYFLLLGRHFYVVDESTLPDGEQMYLLYHLPDQRIWCNSGQVDAERFNLSTLAHLGLGASSSGMIPPQPPASAATQQAAPNPS